MTVVDTSVMVAIIKQEPDAEVWLRRLGEIDEAVLPASCYLEARMALHSDPNGRVRLDKLLATFEMAVVVLDERQARLAADAFERYGRGTGHPARLNFGDCLAYAAAVSRAAPLMFKGEDFARTDVRTVA